MNTYRTITGFSESQYRVLASRHLGFAWPVYTEEEAKELLEKLRKEHHNANHVCFAWRIGWDKKHFRSSDDGEPSGTAGKPILGQIQSFDLTNILIAVVRYFGGTKLGTGGLIDAYKTTAQQCIQNAIIEERDVKDHVRIIFTYEQMPAVMKLTKEADIERLHHAFGETCEMEFLVKKSVFERLITALEDLNVEATHLGRR